MPISSEGCSSLQRIKALFKKHKELILYVVFGALTTLVNYILYFSCTSGFKIGWSAATVIAWVGAVLFAYFTNRKWVFASKSHGAKAVLSEFLKFIAARLSSLALEWLTLKLLLDILHFDAFQWKSLPVGELVAKTIGQLLVIITNYILSKLVVFAKKPSGNE